MRIFSNKKAFSALLNLIGLTVAFTVCLVLSVQVKYDVTYDRNYENHDRIYRLEYTLPTYSGVYSITLSRPIIEALRTASPDIMASVTSWGTGARDFKREDNPEKIYRLMHTNVDEGMLEVFPFRFTQGDTAAFHAANAAVISESAAGLMFPDESPVGQIVSSDRGGTTYKIVAVYEDFAENCTVPNGLIVNMGDEMLEVWSEWSFELLLRLNSPESKENAEKLLDDKLESILGDMYEGYLDETAATEDMNASKSVRLTNLHDVYYSKDVYGDRYRKGNKSTTYTLLAVAVLIILIAIINFINFSMASIPFIIRSVNTRKVYGAGRAGLIFRQLREVFIVVAIAFGFSMALMHLLSSTHFASFISGSLAIPDNADIILAGLAAALVTALVSGLVPGVYSTSFQPAMVLKGSFSLSSRGKAMRTALVCFQYITSFLLIIAALFINVQVEYMKGYDMGFDREHILMFRVSGKIASDGEGFAQKLKDNPDISDVTFADNMLVSNRKMGWGRVVEGQHVSSDVLPVARNFIDFFGMEIVEGRDFSRSDELNPNGTFIMNEKMIAAYPFLRVGGFLSGHAEEDAEIVGIVRDFNSKPLHYGIDALALYLFGSEPWRPLSWVYVKISPANVKETISYIRTCMGELDPETVPEEVDIRFLDESIGDFYGKEENLNTLIGIAAILSLLISVIGILGLVYFETQFRRKEIALRRVNGSSIKEILKMLNRHYLILTMACFIVAAPIAYVIIRIWVRAFTYQSPVPAWIFIAALLIVSVITVTVVTLRSHRTASANPVDALREE